jgi:hypothetical protein
VPVNETALYAVVNQREAELGEDAEVPPLLDRLEGIFLAPVETLRALEPRWGWAGPWLAVLVVGIVHALVAVSFVDHRGLGARRSEYAFEMRPEQDRRMGGLTQEQRDQAAKVSGFISRMGHFVGPSIGAVLRITITGVILFGVAAVSGGKKNLLHAIVVAAHVKAVAIAGHVVAIVSIIAVGNPDPRTSPANLVDELAAPHLYALLDGLDAISIWHTVLLGIGLTVALGVPKRRAALVATALHVVPWLLWVAIGFASVAGKGK